jgi:hypothetical protein
MGYFCLYKHGTGVWQRYYCLHQSYKTITMAIHYNAIGSVFLLCCGQLVTPKFQMPSMPQSICRVAKQPEQEMDIDKLFE